MGMPDTAKRLHKINNKDLITDEVEAVDNYDKAIEESDNPEDVATYEHIKGEEEEHIEELEGLDKMKADDITSEQAWEDFKAGYSDFKEKHIDKGRDGDQASLEEKIDILSAKISELNTDMSRLTDSVPQALGTIEEGKTLEEEAEENDEASEDGDLFGGEDDGLGEYFDDEDGSEGEVFGEEEMSDEGIVDDEDGESMDDELTDDKEFEEQGSDGGEAIEDENIVDGEEVNDEDYISIDDIDSEDEDMESDEGEEEVVETEEEEDDVEKTLAKMVSVLEKMDKRITILERENIGLKKQLSERKTVQTEPRNVAKSRPVPNTNLRLVKGSYNRPPVSTQYVSNQRDIGIGMKKESSNTSVFNQGLNEVFEECNRIANQTR